MLIEHYDLDIFTPPCDPGAERFAAKALLTVDISEVLPYLNATLHGAIYTQGADALVWKKTGHNVAFHAYEIGVSNVEDREAALKELKGLVDLVNRTWERRDEITPDHQMRQRPTVMGVFKLLPGTNCRRCGQPNCWGFALRLVAGQAELAACTPLYEPANADNLAALEAAIGSMPAIGPQE